MRRASCVASVMVVALATTPLAAQTAPAPEQNALVEVTRATALGGSAAKLALGGGGEWLLSAGSLGDLVVWDVRTRAPVRHVAARGRSVVGMAMHPREPWALVAWTSPDDGADLWHVDLRDGACRPVACDGAGAIWFAPDGDHFAIERSTGRRNLWPAKARVETFRSVELHTRAVAHAAASELALDAVPDAAPPPRPARRDPTRRSPSGAHAVVWDERRYVLRREPSGVEHAPPLDFPPLLHDFAIADDGTIVAADWHGGVHWLGVADADRVAAAPHAGLARDLVFTADGRFLAIVGPGAVRVVDLAGREVATFAGVHVVTAGTDGADLWLLGTTSLRRWNASLRRDVSAARSWPAPSLALRREVRMERDAALLGGSDRWHGPVPAVTLGEQVWLGSGAWVRIVPVRIDGDGPTRIALRMPPLLDECLTPVACARGGAPEHALVLFGPDWPRCSFGFDPGSVLCAFAADGGDVRTWRTEDEALWLAAPGGGGHVWIGLRRLDPCAVRVDLATLATTATVPLANAWRAVAVAGRRVLALDGATLRVLDGDTLAPVRSFALPRHVAEAGLLAATPDGSHVAVAARGDVRILRVDGR